MRRLRKTADGSGHKSVWKEVEAPWLLVSFTTALTSK